MNAKAKETQIEIDGLDTADLIELKARIDEAMTAKRQARILTFRAEATALAKELDMTTSELIHQARLTPHYAPAHTPQARATGKVEPKYRNPATGETWAGRGRKPAWIEAHIKEGGSVEDFTI